MPPKKHILNRESATICDVITLLEPQLKDNVESAKRTFQIVRRSATSADIRCKLSLGIDCRTMKNLGAEMGSESESGHQNCSVGSKLCLTFVRLRPLLFVLLSLTFLSAGVFLLYVMTIKPIARMRRAANWQPVSAIIEESEVCANDVGEEVTYTPHFRYSYVIDGQTYNSSRYSFFAGWPIGYNAKKTLLDQFPRGKQIICYVDPRHPSRAVINRGITSSAYWGLLSPVFLLFGLATLAAGKRSLKQNEGEAKRPASKAIPL